MFILNPYFIQLHAYVVCLLSYMKQNCCFCFDPWPAVDSALWPDAENDNEVTVRGKAEPGQQPWFSWWMVTLKEPQVTLVCILSNTGHLPVRIYSNSEYIFKSLNINSVNSFVHAISVQKHEKSILFTCYMHWNSAAQWIFTLMLHTYN